MHKETKDKTKASPGNSGKGNKPFKKAIPKKNVRITKANNPKSSKELQSPDVNYSVDKSYSTNEKLELINKGLPYSAIEKLSGRMDKPVKSVLSLFDLAQTTYNLKKRDQALMSRRDTETVLCLNELIDFGIEVFNAENEKFLRWLRKPNLSLGGAVPENLLNSMTGIQEVKGCLARIEYGNMA